MGLSARRFVVSILSVSAAGLFALAFLRYQTFHNETFDLAFYARIAWGLSRLDPRESIVGGHFLGLHLSFVLFPLGLLGRALAGAYVPVLLLAQSAAVAAAGWPLARMAHRRLGDRAAIWIALAWVLYPNISQVATFEFHPGTIAVLPIAWCMDALDRKHAKHFVLGVIAVLLCREDLALVTAMMGLVFFRTSKTGLYIFLVSTAYIVFFSIVLLPTFGPKEGSLSLHFGRWGQSVPQVVHYLILHPSELFAHLGDPARLLYLPKILAPLLLLPLLSPRTLFIAAPILAMNLISHFRTTTWMDSHYLTPAVPILFAGSIEGMQKLRQLRKASIAASYAPVLLAIACLGAHVLRGQSPASLTFNREAFTFDERSHAAGKIVDAIPNEASVQAPYELMPHLAARRLIYKAPPPERTADFVVVDVEHRLRFRHSEDLLRTFEEPVARAWLEKPDFALIAAEGPYFLMQRGRSPRQGIGRRIFVSANESVPRESQRIARCLSVIGAAIDARASLLEIDFFVHEPCPNDLAIRMGSLVWKPKRVDLLFGGIFPPSQLRAGERVRSVHEITEDERVAIEIGGLRVGGVRSSGARPEPDDPTAVDVPLVRR